jgi:heme-degrading monooxygenase HmoA
MIRVVYRWTVDPQQADAFAAAWWEATGYIQQTWPDARGSVLLKSQLEANVYLAVARWTSVEAWSASRQGESVVPAAVIERMKAAASGPASYEIFDEVLDWASAPDAELRPG